MANQQRVTAAEQLWEALQESKALAASLKAPWTAVETCQQLAELLDTVSALLSSAFKAYRDELFIDGLNTHLQSSAQLLQFGLLKASRLATHCCATPGSCANTNRSKSPSAAPDALRSTAASAAADIQLAVTVLATAVQYLEATQTLKQAETAAVQHVSVMNLSQLLQHSSNTHPSSQLTDMNQIPTGSNAAEAAQRLRNPSSLPCPASPEAVATLCSTAADSHYKPGHKSRSSVEGEPRLLQNEEAAPAGAIADDETPQDCKGSSCKGKTQLPSPFAAAAADPADPASACQLGCSASSSSGSGSGSCSLAGGSAAATATAGDDMTPPWNGSPADALPAVAFAAETAVGAAQTALQQHTDQPQQQQSRQGTAAGQLHRGSYDTAASPGTAASASKADPVTKCSVSAKGLLHTAQATDAAADEVPMAHTYDAVRLQALKEVLVPGSTWSLADDGGNFQYVCSPASTGLRWQQTRQQQQQQQVMVGQQQQQRQVGEESTTGQLQAGSNVSSPDCIYPTAGQPQTSAAGVGDSSAAEAAGDRGDAADTGKRQRGGLIGSSNDAGERELVTTSIWLQQQLQQVYSNPLLQGPKQQQQRHTLLRRSYEASSGTSPSSNLQGLAVDQTAQHWGVTDPPDTTQQQQGLGSTPAGQETGFSGRRTGSNPTSSKPISRSTSRPGSPDIGQPAAAATGFNRLSSDSGFNSVLSPGAPGFRVKSEPRVLRVSAEQMVNGLLGGKRSTSSSSSSTTGGRAAGSASLRSSLRDSILSAEGPAAAAPAAAAARRSSGSGSTAAWARNSRSGGGSSSSSSAGGKRAMVTSAVGASVVQMLVGATAAAASSGRADGLAAAVQRQLSQPLSTDGVQQYISVSDNSPAAAAAGGGGGGGSGGDKTRANTLAEAQMLLKPSSHHRYLRKTTDGIPGYKTDDNVGLGSRSGSEPGFKTASRSSSVPRGSSNSSSSSSGRGYSEIYRDARSSSRTHSASGGVSAAAAAACRRSSGEDTRSAANVKNGSSSSSRGSRSSSSSVLDRLTGVQGPRGGLTPVTPGDESLMLAPKGSNTVQRLSSSSSSGSGCSGGGRGGSATRNVTSGATWDGTTSATRGGTTSATSGAQTGSEGVGIVEVSQMGSSKDSSEVVATRRSSNGLEVLLQQRQQRWQQQQRKQQETQAVDREACTPAAAQTELQMRHWEQQQQHRDDGWEQQWQQQQKAWQQQQQQAAHSARVSSSGNMQELSFAACAGSSIEGQQDRSAHHLAATEHSATVTDSSTLSTKVANNDDSQPGNPFCCQEGPGEPAAAAAAAAASAAIDSEGEAAEAEAKVYRSPSPIQRLRASGRVSSDDAAAAAPRDSNIRSSLMTLSDGPATKAATAFDGSLDASAAAASAAVASDPVEAAAQALLSSGNTAYTAGDYAAAAKDYRAAMDKLGGSLTGGVSNTCYNTHGRTVLLTKCSLNVACCHLRLGQYRQCLGECDAILEVDPFNVVALCHRARALLMCEQHAAAKADLVTAQELLAEEAAGQQQQQHCGFGMRAVSPNTLARMRLNNTYWQERVDELLSKINSTAVGGTRRL